MGVGVGVPMTTASMSGRRGSHPRRGLCPRSLSASIAGCASAPRRPRRRSARYPAPMLRAWTCPIRPQPRSPISTHVMPSPMRRSPRITARRGVENRVVCFFRIATRSKRAGSHSTAARRAAPKAMRKLGTDVELGDARSRRERRALRIRHARATMDHQRDLRHRLDRADAGFIKAPFMVSLQMHISHGNGHCIDPAITGEDGGLVRVCPGGTLAARIADEADLALAGNTRRMGQRGDLCGLGDVPRQRLARAVVHQRGEARCRAPRGTLPSV